MPFKFPNESPDYRAARDALLTAEIELTEQVARVAKMRRALPPGGTVKEDYAFTRLVDGAPQTVRLSDLFAPGKRSLFLYSFMYGPEMADACPSCTSIIDSFDGAVAHAGQTINFAVVAKSPIERVAAFAADRGWRRATILSSHGTTYNVDYGAETESGGQLPAANVFVKSDGAVRHFWAAEQLYAPLDRHPRHMDLMWPLWNILDATPDGRGGNDWGPKLSY